MNVEIIIWLIAYGGAAIHILMKLSEVPNGKSLFSGFTRRDLFVTIASFIAIPVLLEILTDTSLKELLPLNKVTAFLAGYQTQSLLRSLTQIAGSRYLKPSPDASGS